MQYKHTKSTVYKHTLCIDITSRHTSKTAVPKRYTHTQSIQTMLKKRKPVSFLNIETNVQCALLHTIGPALLKPPPISRRWYILHVVDTSVDSATSLRTDTSMRRWSHVNETCMHVYTLGPWMQHIQYIQHTCNIYTKRQPHRGNASISISNSICIGCRKRNGRSCVCRCPYIQPN